MDNAPFSSISNRLWKPFRRGDLIFIFFLALTLRLIMFAASNDQAGTKGVMENCFDCNLYLNTAKSVAYGTGDFENGFFYFGPGYPYFLAANVLLLASRVVPIIIVNILISSLACLLIYLLAMKLTRSYPTAVVASLLSATSYTSINLSCYILSDTLYFAVFLSGLLIYLHALDTGKWFHYIAAGIVVGLAALIRPVAQFWPLMMIVIGVASYMSFRRSDPGRYMPARRFAARVAVAVLIALAIISSWMIRNYKVHGVYTMAMTSANGPANLAAVTIERLTGTYSKEVMQSWYTERLEAENKPQLTLGEHFKLYLEKAGEITDTLRWEVVKTYFSILWVNLNDINFLHRHLIPRCSYFTIPMEQYIHDHYLNYLNFVFSMFGLVILIWRRRYRIAVILGGLYFYYAAMIGFLRWQGSRYFFPGQMAWAVLVAITLVFLGGYLFKALNSLYRRLKPTSSY